MRSFTGLSLILIFILPSAAIGVPTFLTHQGRVVQSNSAPMTGSSDVTFELYGQATGGSALWTQQMSVTFDDGFYSVVLGPGSPELSTDIFDGSNLYLGITLAGLEEFAPRTRITTVPYAMRAEVANSLSDDLSTLTLPSGPASEMPTAGSSNLGQIYLSTDDGNVYYSNGSEWVNISAGGSGEGVEYPNIDSIDPDQIEPGEDVTITLSGQYFEDGCEVEFNSTMATSTSFSGSTEVSVTTGTELASGTYKIRLTNPHGLRDTLADGLVVDAVPVWDTEAGDLGFIVDASTGTHVTFVATDAEEQTLTYALTSGSLPPGVSLNTETGELSGDPEDVSDDQEYTFEITVSDTARTPNEVAREFTIAITHLIGAVAEAPGNSCKHILDMSSSQGDGVYWIKPTDAAAYQIYCDMTSDGGGWTLFEIVSTGVQYDGTYWSPNPRNVEFLAQFGDNPNQVARLGADEINAICTSGDGYLRHYYADNSRFVTDWFNSNVLSDLDIAFAVRGDSSRTMGFRAFGNGDLTVTSDGDWRRYHGPLSDNRICTSIYSGCGGSSGTSGSWGPLCDTYGCNIPGERNIGGHFWMPGNSGGSGAPGMSYGGYGTYGSRWCR